MELATLIARHARYRPRAPAVVFEDQRFDWRQFDERVNRLANALRHMGVGKGDKVATVLPNCLELIEIYWAAPKLGAVLVPLSPLLMPAGLASLLADSEASVVFTQQALVAVFEQAFERVPALRRERVVITDASVAGYSDFGRITAAARPDEPPAAAVGSDDLFNIMYTSGTTGLPKGIMHTHFIRAMYGTLMANAWRMTPESVVMHSGAIVFNGAFVTLMPCFYQGACYVLRPAFDAADAIETIERERVTHTMMVPAQIIAMLDHPAFAPERLASLEMILSLGAPLPHTRKDELNRLLPGRFYELYGLTEGFVTILDRSEALRKAGSVGCPPQFYDMRIERADGSEAEPGEIGEIVGRGPILMTGYFKRPDLTAQALRDGWLHSGDMGYVDDEGYLYLVDRMKDMIDSGGVKVYPKDIEEIASQHPAVAEVAVFGIPHDKWGETPLAAVVLKSPGAVAAEQLKEWINARVGARYQRVQEVVIKDAFPRNAAGKTLKREMREPYWAGRSERI
jgi:acyl-CoA synthetase (AMP-forming)/AMP-acid ligase II